MLTHFSSCKYFYILDIFYLQISKELESSNAELARLKSESETLRKTLEEKISDLESGVRSKEGALAEKVSELERVSEERNAAEARLVSVEAELEELRCRETSLANELELLNQVCS